MSTITIGNFEWDEDKEKINIKKHGLKFIDVIPIFNDPLFMEKLDIEHSINEIRFWGIGRIQNTVLIISCYTTRQSKIRIINARITTKKEEKLYYDWCSRNFYS